jgi:alpha/beta superfamily hydrolase
MHSNPLVVFSHGKETGPLGKKIQELSKIARSAGAQTLSVDYTKTQDPSQRVEILLNTPLPPHKHLILVGSSMGAYVSTVASEQLQPHGLLLMAPAFGLEGYPIQDPIPHTSKCAAVHGWNDEVVPPQNVFRWAKSHQCKLVMVKDDHSLHHEIRVVGELLEKMIKH